MTLRFKVLGTFLLLSGSSTVTEQQSRRRLGGRTPAESHLIVNKRIPTILKTNKAEGLRTRPYLFVYCTASILIIVDKFVGIFFVEATTVTVY